MRRLTLAVLALAALSALALAAGNSMAAKGGGGANNLTVSASPNPVVFFRRITLSGKLTG